MYRMTALMTVLIAALGASASAQDADAPDFIDGTYATDPKACKADANPEETQALTIDSNGIYGFEFGCTFLDNWSELNGEETTGYIALASCGDDSGIIRPDFISIIPEGDDELRVQSQNEYAISEALALSKPGKNEPAKEGEAEAEDESSYEFVSAIYKKCPAKKDPKPAAK